MIEVLIEVTVLIHVLFVGYFSDFCWCSFIMFSSWDELFYGDNALFTGSIDSLFKSFNDVSIILTSTRFNVAIIFFRYCCRISSCVHWSNKMYRWSISLWIYSFMTAVVMYSLKTFTSWNIYSLPTLSDLIGIFDGSTGMKFRR